MCAIGSSHREPGEYWTDQDISARLDQIEIPALHIAGWFDTYLEGSIARLSCVARRMRAASLRGENQYLIAGPWVHIPWGDRVGEANLGDAANLNTDALLLQVVRSLAEGFGGFNDEPRIRYFALGANEWRSA